MLEPPVVPEPEPVLPAPEPVLGPEPMPELDPVPELPMPLELGEVVLPPDVPPALLEPLPLVMFSSRRHFSRSAPTMPRHLLLLVPVAPLELEPETLGLELEAPLEPDAPDDEPPAADEPPPDALSDELGEELEPALLPVALGELELLLPLGDVVLLPVALGVLLLLAPAPVLPALAPDAPEPELCATETLAIAKSAAAVAVPTSLNILI